MRTQPTPNTLLGGLTIEAFLENYWQKKPLLIRGAFSGYSSPISADDLMRIACDSEAEARLILEKDGDYPWQLLYGPFEEDFSDMPESHWTLLVQEVNRYVPEIAALLEAFRFLPSWRIDDIMVSFAKRDGGVGAHVDNYDVFLLQAMGHRNWEIMTTPVVEEHIVPDIDVRMLQQFTPDEQWVLAPGDMLYLPPRVAHKGTAMDDCMTYSVGFRAPSHIDIVSGFLGFAAENMDENLRYTDPDLMVSNHPSRITPEALQQVREILRKAVSDNSMIDRWFGQFVTEPTRDHFAYPLDEPIDKAALIEHIKNGGRLERFQGATFAFSQDADDAQLFVAGDAFSLPASISKSAPLLCESSILSRKELAPYLRNDDFLTILLALVNEGYLELTPLDLPDTNALNVPPADG